MLKLEVLCALALIASVAFAYAPVFTQAWDWAEFDDQRNFAKNVHIRSWTRANVVRL
jgi:hypothetical protein